MIKFEKIIGCASHMCYAHAIHLAVCDVLYKKRVDWTESANEFEEDDIHESEEEDDIHENEEDDIHESEEEADEFEELREDLSQT